MKISFRLLDCPANLPHPQVQMRNLGITYREAVPQSMIDCWEFYGCENIPDVLPPWIRLSNRAKKKLAKMRAEKGAS